MYQVAAVVGYLHCDDKSRSWNYSCDRCEKPVMALTHPKTHQLSLQQMMNFILCWVEKFVSHTQMSVCQNCPSANNNNTLSSQNNVLSDAVCHELVQLTGTAGPTCVVLHKNSLSASEIGTEKLTVANGVSPNLLLLLLLVAIMSHALN